MRHTLLTLTVALILAGSLAGCGAGATATPIPTIVLSSGQSASSSGVSASGEVVPVQKASLSFPLTGIVKDVKVHEGDQVTTGQPLATLDTSILQAQVDEDTADLSQMQIQYRLLQRTGTDQEHLDSAQADIDRAQATLHGAEATLAQATLTAPFGGTIAAVNIVPSETVVPGQVVIQLGDFTNFQVETTDLSERDVPRVKVGQTAQVSVIALHQSFGGKVTDIARVSTTIGGDVVYKVTISFDTQPTGLLWGMTADVQVATSE